jgi:glutaminyl-tRNA synthetase
MTHSETPPVVNFIQHIINQDLASGKNGNRVATRFPPEPNGFLHIGHAKSICLNFGIAESYPGATCNLRFDDTNPEKESQVYINAIQRDIEWLGFHWNADVRFASDYFDRLYAFAQELIGKGKAYVCGLSPDQARAYRGTLTQPGKDSPDRERSVAENLALFERMRQGEFADGQFVLRAKIDMASPNINMRDPILYRIRHVQHHQTGDKWCIYPMYDYTHCISDALENITHSLCTLEFADHRPLYDWILDHITIDCHPQQIEFARLNLNYTVTSKRKLKKLVDDGLVDGWDDPRLPTIAGLRRRGFTPRSIRQFCERVGVTKADGTVDFAMLEFSVRDDLDKHAPRAMAVLNPLKVIIDNYPVDNVEDLLVANHPKDDTLGQRSVAFSREIYIDHADFMEVPPKQYKRLVTGGEVRLRGAYVIKCNTVVKDATGNIVALHCSYDADTLGKNPVGRKVQGVIHWVDAARSIEAEVRLYDRLFIDENPDQADEDFTRNINPHSLVTLPRARLEAGLAQAPAETPYQFEREGYFCRDEHAMQQGKLVFNRTVTLRDTWAKINK